MVINDLEIIRRGKEDNLISPFDSDFVQPNSIDLTLGNNFLFPKMREDIENKTEIYREEDNVWERIFIDDEDPYIAIPPFSFVLGTTAEKINMPDDLLGMCAGKSTIGRRGLQVECAGVIDGGFSGQITLEILNMAPYIIKLREGMPICQVVFHQAMPPETNYSDTGHYNGQNGATEPYTID